jgi:hypothetical protein
MLDTKEIKWDILLNQLSNGKCTLVFGNGLLTDEAGQSRFAQFCKQYAADNAGIIHAYYPEENFFLFKSDDDYSDFGYYIEQFYKNPLTAEDELVYQQLAEIPFSLYISVAADDFLVKKLGENGQHTFYGDSNLQMRAVESTKDYPLVYNIFGSVKDTSQVVFSHDALYDFLQSILEKKHLPMAVQHFFNENAKGGEVLFLGFDFRQWYVQLLLRILNLTKSTNKLKRTSSLDENKIQNTQPISEYHAQHHFKINFVAKDCREFVQLLYDKCKENGLLRNLTSIKEKVVELTLEDKKQRMDTIKKQKIQLNKLLNEWEEKEITADNPTERLLCETEITKLREKIEQYQQELNDLAK